MDSTNSDNSDDYDLTSSDDSSNTNSELLRGDYDEDSSFEEEENEDLIDLNLSKEPKNIFESFKVPQQSPKQKTVFPKLPIIEIIFYFICFWAGAIYSLYRFYRTSQRWGKYLSLTKIDNSWFGTRQDHADLEWFVWIPALVKYAPIAVLHMILAQTIRKYKIHYLPMFYITFSVFVLIGLLGVGGTLMCFLVPFVMFAVLLTRTKVFIWITWCLILVVFNTTIFSTFLDKIVGDIPDGDYKVSVMVAWIILRSLSLSLDTCDTDPESLISPKSLLIILLAYCFYLPFLMTGPYMPFVDFLNGLNKNYEPWSMEKVVKSVIQIFRFLWWMFLCHILLFNFYAHSLNFSFDLVTKMSSWSLGGFSYFLMIFFNIKYVVLYGLPGTFARVEGYEPPNPPRCCLLSYRFSDVWRHFDEGLYKFMIKHIYVPWIQISPTVMRKLQGSVLVFTFVYVWHGVNPQVFWWSFTNFLGIALERTGLVISQTDAYKHWENKWLPGAWSRRMYGLLAVTLFVPLVISMLIFLSSLENAITVAHRVFISGFPHVTGSMFFFMFCLGQCSMEVDNWRIQRTNKLKLS